MTGSHRNKRRAPRRKLHHPDPKNAQARPHPQGAEESPSQPVAAVGIISVHGLRSQ